MNFTAKGKVALGVLAAIAACGVAAWIYQLMGGLSVTGMSNGVSWGLYIACFMFLVGLSAGGLIVASSASIFHVKQYKQVALPAIIVSTVCITMAAMFVCIDLGGVQRVLNLLLSPNFTSPLMWDVCVISIYLILNIIYLVFMKKYGVDSRQVSIVSRFALPTAILVHSVTAWIFGLEIAKEGWNSAIMAPLFVVSAMDSGLGLLLIVLAALKKAKMFEVSRDLMANLAGLMCTCVAIDGFMVFCEVLTEAYNGTAMGSAIIGDMLFGATAPFFWTEIVLGVLVPFCVLVFAKNRQREGLVVFASACVVVGVFCKRVWLLFTSFLNFNVAGAPGVSIGNANVVYADGGMWMTIGSYLPTWTEFVIVAGMFALGALAIMVMSKLLLGKQDADASPAAVGGAAPQGA